MSQKFGVFDKYGFPIGFYDEEISSGVIPEVAVALTDEQWGEFIQNQGLRRWTGTEVEIYTPPPMPMAPDFSVSAAQALIQLSRMPHDGSVVPGAKNLAEATEALVAQSGDYELKTWFARAQRWIITNPNVQKIGTAFGLTAEQIQAAFDAASKIQE